MGEIPPVLLPYQQRWASDHTQVKICEKSRRIGITWAQAGDSALLAAQQSGMSTWYLGYNQSMSGEFIRDCAEWSRWLSLAASEIEEDMFEGGEPDRWIHGFKITYASGHRVVALSSKPANLRGKQGLVVVDEAAFHPDLPGLIKAGVALTMWGGRVAIISTHDGDLNPFYEVIEETRAGKRPYSLHRCTIDEALADGLYQRIALVTGQVWTPEREAEWRRELFDFYGDDADEELLCIASSGSGAYISRISIERCMVPERPVVRLALDEAFLASPEAERVAFIDGWILENLTPLLLELPRHAKHALGEDFGRSGDLTDLVVMSEADDLTYDVPFVVELRNVPFEAQKQIVLAVLGQLPHFVKAAFDAGGNGAYLAEVAQDRHRGKVEAIKLSDEWYRLHMPKLKDAIETLRLRVPRHADTLRDLRAIEIIRGVPKVADKRQKGTDGKPRHADYAIAQCLAWYAATEAGEPGFAAIENTSAERNPYASERMRGRRKWMGI